MIFGKDSRKSNANEELVQRVAWRLVRSAEDRIGAGRGAEKLLHATRAIEAEFKGIKNAEDYIRAAFVQFKAETKAYA